MKSFGAASIGMLFLLGAATAQTAGPYAAGTYRFVLEDGVTKSLELSVSTDERGITTGSMSFIDPTRIPDTDDPEDSRAGDAPPELYFKASLNNLKVEKNRAVMDGTIRESTHKSYIGRWIQLVVEDNGTGLRVPDQLTWSICKPKTMGWIPSDAERKDDDGAYLRWWATDAERDDDVGIPSPNLLGNDERFCPIYPFSFYTFADLVKWDGDIVVQP